MLIIKHIKNYIIDLQIWYTFNIDDGFYDFRQTFKAWLEGDTDLWEYLPTVCYYKNLYMDD